MSAGQPIPLSEIELHPALQLRGGTNPETVSRYVEARQAGEAFPPAVVFWGGGDTLHILADGFHRYEAEHALHHATLQCDVRPGGLREAILFAAGANASHGLPRTMEDKRRAVLALLTDPEWSQWSDREIARRCRVSHTFVGKLRADPLAPLPAETGTVATRPDQGSRAPAQPLPSPLARLGLTAFKKIGRATEHLPEPEAIAQKLSRRQRAEWAERADRLSAWFSGLAAAARAKA